MSIRKPRPKRVTKHRPKEGKVPGGRMNYHNKTDKPNPFTKWILLIILLLFLALYYTIIT